MKKSLLALCAIAITGFATFSAFTDAESDEAKIAKELDAKIAAFKGAESTKCRETAMEAARTAAADKLAVLQTEFEAMAKKKGIKIPTKPKTPTVKPAPTPEPTKTNESPKLDIKGNQGEGKLDVKATNDGKTQGSGKLKIK